MNDIELILLEEEDIELIRNWRNSENVSKYMNTSDYISEENQRLWFQRIKEEKNSKYWIISFEGKKLGLVYLMDIDFSNKSCFWGFYLGDQSVRGAGVGSKVEYKVLTHVFEVLGLNKLKGEVLEFNSGVIKLHEKFGFRREAFYRQHIFKDGIFHNVVGIALLKTEWDNLKTKLYETIYNK